jgi:hypothetical protein
VKRKDAPARCGSAFHAGYWLALWIYFTAPTLGMLAAGEVFLRARGDVAPYCAKLTTPITNALSSTTDMKQQKNKVC